MLTFPPQSFANGVWTLTPAEPTSMQLALIGFGSLAIYAMAMHRSTRRATAMVSAMKRKPQKQVRGGKRSHSKRRAA
jgi:hypothetical protein